MTQPCPSHPPFRPSRLHLLLAAPMALLTGLMLSQDVGKGWIEAVSATLAFVFVNALFVRMLWTGRTDRYRAILFVTLALTLTFSFVAHMLAARGSMALSAARVLDCQVPFCHIVTTMILLPMALAQAIIFPGQISGAYAAIGSMLVICLAATLALGRGFCGWFCFFGGWEDGFSRLFRKPRVRRLPRRLLLLPFAVLLVAALTSAWALEPTYCIWACPFKTVTEYVEVAHLETLVQAVIFVGLFAGLVVVLPILSRRRTQCSWFCPMGALQTLLTGLNPFRIRVDPARCVRCGLCIRECPMFALDEASLTSGHARAVCVKCGKCVDACPKGAIRFAIRGEPATATGRTARLLFLFVAFLFLAMMAGGTLRATLEHILRWAAGVGPAGGMGA